MPVGRWILSPVRMPVPPLRRGSEGRDRTCDVLVNSQALYQLSYLGMVGAAGIEPATGRLRAGCSTN